ncbi:MAG: RidA family protein [Hyphomicrobium denitrificans]|nr:RidA family protein [Hyphomicrobium denitrificans]
MCLTSYPATNFSFPARSPINSPSRSQETDENTQTDKKSADVLTGLLGTDVSVEDGRIAARFAALSLLAQAKAALGTLDRVVQILRVTGFVASAPGFYEQPAVINGASDLLVAALGDAGRHTRSAIGVANLPLNTCVEIDAIIKVR